MKGIVITFIVALTTIPIVLFAQPERKYIRQGISYYKQAIDDSNRVDTTVMKKAVESYQKALEYRPTSIEGRFNLANAKLKMGDFQQAEREYRSLQSAIVHDSVKAKIYHNLGNAQLYQGKIKESIEAYKNALRLNPNDLETKYNLAFAQSKLRQMKNQQQQNQNQDQNNNDNQQNQQNNQQQQNQQQAQQQRAEEKQAREEPMKEEQNQPKDDKQKFSKEDAARILEALQNQEQRIQDKLNKERKSRSRQRPSRDW